MSKTQPYYLTTTIPYVNSDPHIGFALEIVHADIVARFMKLSGREVFFNTGTDEHGAKVYKKALEAKLDPQTYADGYAETFRKLREPLGIVEEVNFIRTTDAHHKMAAQEFWKRCSAKGDIYKKNYKIKYCVGCELEKTESELVEGKCPIHPNLEIEVIEEENYFFKLSAYKDYLLGLYESTDFVVPDYRLNELRTLIKEKGLEDFSISRIKSKMPWGVDVPGDDEHVMYVWFDAFVNYISAIGWPDRADEFKKWWRESGGVVQVAGKDQVRQQACMWQAMLKSADLTPSKQIFIHGFITSGGQKMSKSLGNVISPYDVVKEFGTDATRLFLASDVSFYEDSDVTMARLKESYNSKLANGLGNLVSRIMKMSTTYGVSLGLSKDDVIAHQFTPDVAEYFERFEVAKVAELIWNNIASIDALIQEKKPFSKIKTDEKGAKEDVRQLLSLLLSVAVSVEPIMPETSKTIIDLVRSNKMPEKPLFTRKD